LDALGYRVVLVKVEFAMIIFKDNFIHIVITAKYMKVVASMNGNGTKKVQLKRGAAIDNNGGDFLKLLSASG
jgi:hypothetical protein